MAQRAPAGVSLGRHGPAPDWGRTGHGIAYFQVFWTADHDV